MGIINTKATRLFPLESMFLIEAMSILGCTVVSSCNETAIHQAWKQKIKLVHPDKNHQDSGDATKQTQILNEAKDTLLKRLQDNLHTQSKYEGIEKVSHEIKQVEAEQDAKKKLDAKREYLFKNRKKRAPEARVHKSIGNYKEGKELVEEIKTFFEETFVVCKGKKLLTQDIMDHFFNSRTSTTILEANMFKRHCKTLFMTVWPTAIYCTFRNQRSFQHVGFRKDSDISLSVFSMKDFELRVLPVIEQVKKVDGDGRLEELLEIEDSIAKGLPITASGGVYFAWSDCLECTKIGATRREDPSLRLRELSRYVTTPFKLTAWIPTSTPFRLEKIAHEHFSASRIRNDGAGTEFFRIGEEEAIAYAKKINC